MTQLKSLPVQYVVMTAAALIMVNTRGAPLLTPYPLNPLPTIMSFSLGDGKEQIAHAVPWLI
jgi:hypothetical protein